MQTFKLLFFALTSFINTAQAELQFVCPTQLTQLQPDATAYLRALQISADLVIHTVDTTRSHALSTTTKAAPTMSSGR